MSNAVFNNSKLLSRVRGVIEVGASIGEEIPEWEKSKIKSQIFIEPIRECYSILEVRSKQQSHHPSVKCFNLALSDYDGEANFHISTDSFCSSSLLDFSKEAVRYGQTLQTSEVRKVLVRRLDSLVESGEFQISDYNLLYIDVQGNEQKLIQGAEKSLSSFDYVFSEVNFIPLYDGLTLWEDFRDYMINKGFRLVNIRKLEGSQGCQGEALFFRNDIKF